MALLAGMMRASAITGDPRYVDRWLAGRQFGRWLEPPAPRHHREGTLRALTDLRDRGIVTDEEFARLRARARV